MKIQRCFLLIISVLAVFACQSEGGGRSMEASLQEKEPSIQDPVQEPADLPETPGIDAGEEEIREAPPAFDPASISPELFQATKVDIQHFIGDLNRIIQSKNYHAWTSNLDESYFEKIRSPNFLEQISASSFLQGRGIVLKDPQDYFFQVVVPSRANSRVDDIEFISPTRVKAYTVSSGGRRLRLYDLEHSGGEWRIIN